MQPSTPISTPIQESAPRFKKSRRFWLAFTVAVVLVIAVAFAAFYYFVLQYNNNPNKYHRLDSYSLTLSGKSGGSGIVFKKPVQISKVSYKTPISVALYQLSASNKIVAYIAASVTPLAHPLPDIDLRGYNRVLAAPTDTYYARTSKTIQTIAQNSLSPKSTIKFANAKQFTSPNIKANAWEFDFTAADPNLKNTPLAGEAIFAITSKGYYSFVAYATSTNWQTYQKTWHQVFNNLKLDQ